MFFIMKFNSNLSLFFFASIASLVHLRDLVPSVDGRTKISKNKRMDKEPCQHEWLVNLQKLYKQRHGEREHRKVLAN